MNFQRPTPNNQVGIRIRGSTPPSLCHRSLDGIEKEAKYQVTVIPSLSRNLLRFRWHGDSFGRLRTGSSTGSGCAVSLPGPGRHMAQPHEAWIAVGETGWVPTLDVGCWLLVVGRWALKNNTTALRGLAATCRFFWCSRGESWFGTSSIFPVTGSPRQHRIRRRFHLSDQGLGSLTGHAQITPLL